MEGARQPERKERGERSGREKDSEGEKNCRMLGGSGREGERDWGGRETDVSGTENGRGREREREGETGIDSERGG